MRRLTFTAFVSLAAVAPVASCTTQPEADVPEVTQLGADPDKDTLPLSGTAWRLVEFQSMDDSQGTTVPEEPVSYSVSFGEDGIASFQFDCNRGSGDWSVEPSSDGDSGSISFGPVASTMALCEEPSMGEKIASDVQYMTGYLLKDGRLYISLMADGGIYAWKPLER